MWDVFLKFFFLTKFRINNHDDSVQLSSIQFRLPAGHTAPFQKGILLLRVKI